MRERFSIEGRVAVVTGGGRGIGRALSMGLADAGAAVVVASRSLDACQDTVKEIEADGGRALALAIDVGTADGRARLVESTIKAFGRLDILVNNAALLKPHLTEKVTEDELDAIIDVDLKGPVFLSTLQVEADHLHGVERDAPSARILRSVLMKPEHETATDWLATRVEQLAARTRPGG